MILLLLDDTLFDRELSSLSFQKKIILFSPSRASVVTFFHSSTSLFETWLTYFKIKEAPKLLWLHRCYYQKQPPKVFYKISVLNNSGKLTGNSHFRVSFITLIWMGFWRVCFSLGRGKITPCLKLVNTMIETWNLVYKYSENYLLVPGPA